MKCIVFDVDDTLYKRSQPFSRAAKDLFGSRFQWDLDELYRIRNIYSEEIFGASQAGKITMEEMYEYRLGKALAHFGYKTCREEVLAFEERYIYYQSLICLDAPFDTLIEALSAHQIPMAVMTNGPSAHQRNKIRALGLEKWICEDRWIVSGDYDFAKPDVRLFEAAALRLSMKPEDLLIIGDNYQSDILGGIHAGWHTLWYNHAKEDPSGYAKKASYQCQTPEELRTLISSLFGLND